MYPDNTKIITKHSDNSLLLDEAKRNQNHIQNWVSANKLILNKQKNQYSGV